MRCESIARYSGHECQKCGDIGLVSRGGSNGEFERNYDDAWEFRARVMKSSTAVNSARFHGQLS